MQTECHNTFPYSYSLLEYKNHGDAKDMGVITLSPPPPLGHANQKFCFSSYRILKAHKGHR